MRPTEILERLKDIFDPHAFDTDKDVVDKLDRFIQELEDEIRLNPEVYT